MSSAQVFEVCKVCGKPTKMRIDFLGKVEIVDVACECERNEQLINDPKKKFSISGKD